LAYFEWDSWREALEAGERLIATGTHSPPVVHANHRRWAYLALAVARERTGAPEQAERLDQLAGKVPPAQETQYIGLFRGRLALARGAYAEAERLLLAATEYRAGRSTLPWLVTALAELGARKGDSHLYDRFGGQALELGWRSGARKALAQAIRARGIAAIGDARWDDAESDLLNALNRYEQLGTSWDTARTRYFLAALATRRDQGGDRDSARARLRQALETFEALHTVSDIERTRAALAGGEVHLL
jgi:tetratricopeptide (TPR) repeat protein